MHHNIVQVKCAGDQGKVHFLCKEKLVVLCHGYIHSQNQISTCIVEKDKYYFYHHLKFNSTKLSLYYVSYNNENYFNCWNMGKINFFINSHSHIHFHWIGKFVFYLGSNCGYSPTRFSQWLTWSFGWFQKPLTLTLSPNPQNWCNWVTFVGCLVPTCLASAQSFSKRFSLSILWHLENIKNGGISNWLGKLKGWPNSTRQWPFRTYAMYPASPMSHIFIFVLYLNVWL